MASIDKEVQKIWESADPLRGEFELKWMILSLRMMMKMKILRKGAIK